jgi:hypothetical protein
LHALLNLVIHGSHRQILLQGAESGLGIVELHVHVPQLLLGLSGQVRTQKVCALGISQVRRLGHGLAPGQRQGLALTLDGDVVRPCHARAFRLEPPDALPERVPATQPSRRDRCGQPPEAILHLPLEAVVHRRFLLAPVC